MATDTYMIFGQETAFRRLKCSRDVATKMTPNEGAPGTLPGSLLGLWDSSRISSGTLGLFQDLSWNSGGSGCAASRSDINIFKIPLIACTSSAALPTLLLRPLSETDSSYVEVGARR